MSQAFLGNVVSSASLQKSDQFIPALTTIFGLSKWVGIPTFGGRVFLCWAFVLLLVLLVIVLVAIWNVIRILTGITIDTAPGRGLIALLSGAIFYGNGLLSLVLSWRLISSWNRISLEWAMAEARSGLRLPPNKNIKRHVIVITGFVSAFAVVEHVLSMISAVGFDCPPNELLRKYILVSHGFLLPNDYYNIWIGTMIFAISKQATVLWNYQDLIIILLSIGLASRYKRINAYVKNTVHCYKKTNNEVFISLKTWRAIREAFVKQSALVRKVNEKLGALVLLACTNNLYFICLQLFLGINQQCAGCTTINRVYYFTSLSWLMFRSVSVVLAAASVNVHSNRALPYLYACSDFTFNIEIKRLKNQLSHDKVVLHAMGLFDLDKQMLLKVAAAIVKYELVLIQYD